MGLNQAPAILEVMTCGSGCKPEPWQRAQRAQRATSLTSCRTFDIMVSNRGDFYDEDSAGNL